MLQVCSLQGHLAYRHRSNDITHEDPIAAFSNGSKGLHHPCMQKLQQILQQLCCLLSTQSGSFKHLKHLRSR